MALTMMAPRAARGARGRAMTARNARRGSSRPVVRRAGAARGGAGRSRGELARVHAEHGHGDDDVHDAERAAIDAVTDAGDREGVERADAAAEASTSARVEAVGDGARERAAGVGEDVGEDVDAHGEHEEEYEEYEEEVDYEFHDYVADAKAQLSLLKPDFSWRAAEASTTAAAEAGAYRFLSVRAPYVAAESAYALDAHSVVGTIIACGSMWSVRALRRAMEGRFGAGAGAGAGSSGAAREMTEEERVREAELRAERKEREETAEKERRRVRDEEEARERERQETLARMQAEADAKAAEEEEKRREEMRAELRRKNAEEKARLEARLKAEAEAKAAQLAAERAERDAARAEKERLEAEERARRQIVCDERGEIEHTVSADISVVMKRDNASAPVDVTVSARVGISYGASETYSYKTADVARVAALDLCSVVAAQAMTAYGSDARLQDMMGNGPLKKLPGMDDLEFEHWTRVMQARMDSELRTSIVRSGAALEVKLRETGAAGKETSKSTLRFTRRCLPIDDEANITNRMSTAVDVVAESVLADAADAASGTTSGVVEDVTAIIDPIEFYELGQLHGLHPSIIFPAEHPATGLSGELMASILTLSHFVRRAERDFAEDVRVAERAKQIAATLVGRSANKQGSWRAMYLDGFTGDALTSASAMADTVLPDDDAIRMLLNAAVEDQRRRAAGEQSAFEEEWPDADVVRKQRLKEIRENQPITERLWALRNSAAQLAQSGSKAQARSMLEEALELRKRDVLKKGDDDEHTPEALPELLALVKLLETVDAWADDCAKARVDVLRAVSSAADVVADRDGDAPAAAALFECAMSEYAPFLQAYSDDDDDALYDILSALRASVDARWSAAGVDPADVDAREETMTTVVGAHSAVDAITRVYTKELEARRRLGP
mmetsp:Transcript_6431/g.21033  ORF Transcript_6431/g.21033 Transcript_6431/m.21033 type:complete len:906 (+) Transcript_6431:7044-9761(+)